MLKGTARTPANSSSMAVSTMSFFLAAAIAARDSPSSDLSAAMPMIMFSAPTSS